MLMLKSIVVLMNVILKTQNFKYFSLPHRNNPYGLEFWSSIGKKIFVSKKFALFLINLTFRW